MITCAVILLAAGIQTLLFGGRASRQDYASLLFWLLAAMFALGLIFFGERVSVARSIGFTAWALGISYLVLYGTLGVPEISRRRPSS